jgi:LPXTG-motif cell wall-anchored protein
MASTSTSRRWSSFAHRALGAGAVAAIALVGSAVPASAHVPDAKAICDPETGRTTLTVDLTRYSSEHPNTVKITEGETVIAETDFGTTYQKSFADFSGAVDHTFVVDVKAWNDPQGTKGYSVKLTRSATACVKDTTPPIMVTTTTTTSTTTSTTKAAPAAPTTTTTPVPQGGRLADTGASIAIPAALGALLLVGGATLLFIVRRRRNA